MVSRKNKGTNGYVLCAMLCSVAGKSTKKKKEEKLNLLVSWLTFHLWECVKDYFLIYPSFSLENYLTIFLPYFIQNIEYQTYLVSFKMFSRNWHYVTRMKD